MDTFQPRLEILPAAQQQLWPELRPTEELGFVLYGGTAIALRLAHRQSVDFDFFHSRPIDQAALRQALPFLRTSSVRQDRGNTFQVVTPSGVSISFFGGLDFGRAGQPERTNDGVVRVASLTDLMATKLKVILQRSEAKDYQDIAAMVRAGVRVDVGLAAAEQIFKPTFAPRESLRALVYFKGGDLHRLKLADRDVLLSVVQRVKSLPAVQIEPDLCSRTAADGPRATAEDSSPKIDPPKQGPRMGM